MGADEVNDRGLPSPGANGLGEYDPYWSTAQTMVVNLKESAGAKAQDRFIPHADDEVGSEGGSDSEGSASETCEDPQVEWSEGTLSEASVGPPPAAVAMGAAFAGHEATLVELLRFGSDPLEDALPGAMRAGNARLCAALLEGARLQQLTHEWWLHTEGISEGSGGPSRVSVREFKPRIAVDHGLIALACARARWPQLCDGGCSARGGYRDRPGLAIPEAAVAAAEVAADAAVASVQSFPSLASAAAAATAAALVALRPCKRECGARSSNASSSGSNGDLGGQARVETPLPTANHLAVLLLLLNATSYRSRPESRWGNKWGHGLRAAAVAGEWQVVSELLLAGATPWEPTEWFHHDGAGAILMYLALAYGQWHVTGQLLRWHRYAPGSWGACGTVGAGVWALVTRVLGGACPMMRCLRRAPMQCWDRELGELGALVMMFAVVAVLATVFVLLLQQSESNHLVQARGEV